MKFRILTLILCVSSLCKAQMGGMGQQNGMMSPQMQNMPSGNSGSSTKDEPPHGGEIKESGKYNIEVVYDPFSTEEKLNIWLLKGNYKPAKMDKATARVTIKYPKLDDGTREETKELILSEDRFYCNVSEPSSTFNAFITITVKGKEYTMVYNQKGMPGK